MLFFSLAALLAAIQIIQSVNGQSFPCDEFWNPIDSGNVADGKAQCYSVSGYPKVVSGVQITIVYDTTWTNPELTTDRDQFIALIDNAAAQALNLWVDYQAKVPSIIFTLSGQTWGSILAVTNFPNESEGPCSVTLLSGWTSLVDDNRRREAVAHEMYHCVQAEIFGTSFINGDPWWVEGTAEYFAFTVFPYTSIEGYRASQYNLSTAIYKLDYSTFLFFESMGQGAGPWGVNEWVTGQDVTSSPEEERTRLAGLDGFVDDFHQFARQFTSQTLVDSQKNPIPPGSSVLAQAVSLSTNADDTTGTATIAEIDTFTIQLYEVDLVTGQTVAISYDTDQENVRVAYSQTNSGLGYTWLDMPLTGQTSGAEGSIYIQCNEDQTVPIFVLVTSTDDVNEASITLTIVTTNQDPSCQCQFPQANNQRRGLTHYSGVQRRGLRGCVTQPSQPPISPTSPPQGGCSTVGSSLGSDATPCFSGPAASYGNNCFYGVSCWPTAWTIYSIYSTFPVQPYSELCGSLNACSTSTASNPEDYGYLSMFEVHCSACGVSPATTATATTA